MNDYDVLRNRTKKFAVDVINVIDSLPQGRSTNVLGSQLLRSATAIGANYRAACRARSKAEFVSKMHVVQEEADETQYWIELLHESGGMDERNWQSMMQEAKELTAIFTATEKTARANMARTKSGRS